MNKYDTFVKKMKERLGTDKIIVSITPTGICIDRRDTAELSCIVEVGVYYNALYVIDGDNSVAQITNEDLEDFNILQPLFKAELIKDRINSSYTDGSCDKLLAKGALPFSLNADVNKIVKIFGETENGK